MAYELIYYKNVKGEWTFLRTEGSTTDRAAKETTRVSSELGMMQFYIYVGLLNMWLWQPSYATNATQANVSMIPKEVLALNLLNSVE